MQIESVNNPKIKNLIKLKDKKYRDLTNSFIVEGCHLVREALKRNLVMEIYSLNDEDYGVPSIKITEVVMKRVSMQVSISPVIALCKKMSEEDILGPTLILDGIQDPGNLGTIIRSAVAFSMPNIILSDDAVDLYNPKVIRSTEGMIFHVNVIRRNLREFLPTLKKDYQIIGADVRKGVNIRDLSLNSNYGIVIGSEGSGMGVSREFCDTFIKIPMSDKCESLNAGVSASIIMYECDNHE